MGEILGETAGHGSKSTFCCVRITYYSRNMWSSVVLLKYDVVGLSLDKRNDIRLNNFIPIAQTGQNSGDNNQWCSANVLLCLLTQWYYPHQTIDVKWRRRLHIVLLHGGIHENAITAV
jgi:hypothetical protein